MNDPDDYIQVKRGRPKKFSDEARRRFQLSLHTNVSSNTRAYADLQKNYIKENYSQKLRNMLSRIPCIVKLPSRILQLPLQNFFEESVKQLMVSELEIVGFSLILQRIDLNTTEIQAEELLKLGFFLSKIAFETSEEVMTSIKDIFKQHYKNFESDLSKINPNLTLTVVELNKRYMELNNFMFANINYSYYVDDIVRLSPPYQISDKKHEKKEEVEVKEEYMPRRQRAAETMRAQRMEIDEFCSQPSVKLDYYSLMPLEEHEYYLNAESPGRAKHPFDFLNFLAGKCKKEEDDDEDDDDEEDTEKLLQF